MAENLNEEIKRIKTLFNFKVGDNAHDKLSEENIRKAINEQEVEVEGEDCVTISHVGRFPVSGIAGSGAFKTFMDKIDATIKGNAKLADKVTKGVVYVTDFSLIGGASNHWEGKSVTPERKNDRKSNYSGQPYDKDTKSPEFKKNKALAVSRAKGLADELNGEAGLKGIHVQFVDGVLDHAKDHAQGFIIDTGGINDKPNESSWVINGVTYQPGQVVEVSMTICYQPKRQEENPETGSTVTVITDEEKKILKECFNGATIKVIYNGKGVKKPHNCNHAVYDIYANGYKLKRLSAKDGSEVDYASLNNSARGSNEFDNATIISATNGGKKGRENTFTLTIDGINGKFFNADIIGKHKGKLVINAACRKQHKNETSWSKERTVRQGKKLVKLPASNCHEGVGIVTVETAAGIETQIVKTPNMWGVEKQMAEFPACENIITKVITDKPKVREIIRTWWKKIKDKRGNKKKEVTKKEVTKF